ncbi:MAG: hypothetical protein, partial [Olavius algarvensis Gamma 1 endosymbiont]
MNLILALAVFEEKEAAEQAVRR